MFTFMGRLVYSLPQLLYTTAPSGAPRITEAMAISPTELEVSWSGVAAIDRNGIITVYEVHYQPLRDFEADLTRVNTTNTSIVLTNLHESVQYNITVRAFTRVGPGPFSDHVITITNEDCKNKYMFL